MDAWVGKSLLELQLELPEGLIQGGWWLPFPTGMFAEGGSGPRDPERAWSSLCPGIPKELHAGNSSPPSSGAPLPPVLEPLSPQFWGPSPPSSGALLPLLPDHGWTSGCSSLPAIQPRNPATELIGKTKVLFPLAGCPFIFGSHTCNHRHMAPAIREKSTFLLQAQLPIL